MSVSPTTNADLLKMLDRLLLPCPVRMGVMGLTYQHRGKMASIAASEWAEPAQAILARFLAVNPDLQLPVTYPAIDTFVGALAEVEPFMNRISVRLGREQTFISRALRCQDKPGAAVWSIMALVTNQLNGTPAELWRHVEACALTEAGARGIGNLDRLGRWPQQALAA